MVVQFDWYVGTVLGRVARAHTEIRTPNYGRTTPLPNDRMTPPPPPPSPPGNITVSGMVASFTVCVTSVMALLYVPCTHSRPACLCLLLFTPSEIREWNQSRRHVPHYKHCQRSHPRAGWMFVSVSTSARFHQLQHQIHVTLTLTLTFFFLFLFFLL